MTIRFSTSYNQKAVMNCFSYGVLVGHVRVGLVQACNSRCLTNKYNTERLSAILIFANAAPKNETLV